MLAITTFPPSAWDVYAKHCIGTWTKFWPGSILVYHEGSAPPALMPGVESRPLNMKSRDKFLQLKTPPARNWLHDVKRFCHKVFAQLDAMESHDQFYWIDADVEMTDNIPEWLIDDIINRSFTAFLGRDTYSECGLIAFNRHDAEFPYFEHRYRSCYEHNQIFRLPYWTDCHAFDYARQGGGLNLTPNGRGVDNVLPQSPFGEYMVHHKGRLKLTIGGAQ